MTASAGGGAPDLSVIVVTYNGREMALDTLRSARAAIGDVEVEWIIVDNGSTDGTPEAIRRVHPDACVIDAQNRGFAAGNNVGLKVACGRYVLLLNPDVEVEHGTLADMVRAMDERPEVGLASVLQRGADGRLQPSIRRFPSVARDLGESLFAAHWPILRTCQELETRTSVYARESSVDWVVGAFMLARAEAVRDVGPMDERFFMYSEEVDWCYRFRGAGWDVRHIPQMSVIHYAGRRDRGDLMAQLAYSRRAFAAKHYGAAKSGGVRAALALGNVMRILALLPAASHGRPARRRLAAERGALAVQLGLAGAPVLGAAADALRTARTLTTQSPN